MRAIITGVKKASGYSIYNGLTFEIKDYMKGLVGLKIPSKLDIDKFDTIDFSWNEIFITDVQIEIKVCQNQIDFLSKIKHTDWSKDINEYQNQINYLKKYCEFKKITL